MAYKALCAADTRGELLPGLDLHEISFLISANQWGAVMLWEKGVLQLEQLEQHISKNLFLVLSPLCKGSRKRWIEDQLSAMPGVGAAAGDGGKKYRENLVSLSD